MALKSGAVAGTAGAVGAWFGSAVFVGIPGEALKWMTAAMLVLSGFALLLRMSLVARRRKTDGEAKSVTGMKFWPAAVGVGLATGILSGMFGIGSTPFIQIGLMAILGSPVRLAAGTTMLVIIPIALGGGLGFVRSGPVDMQLLVEVAASLMVGSYIGAKFTRRVPVLFLKTAMVADPMAGGTILLL
jgi:hypothetical protein